MNQFELEALLQEFHLGPIQYFDSIGSTNDEAAHWIKAGCPDLSLVVADEQTTGRGRGGHKWFSPAESALAFSLVLRSEVSTTHLLKYRNTARLNGLGALAVDQALRRKYGLQPQIKWPNDILVAGRKLSGVLAEAHWIGSELAAIVLGIGVNVSPGSIPAENWDTLNPNPFPATSLETVLGAPVERWELLSAILQEILVWRGKLPEPEFLHAWEANLAYRGQWVQITHPGFGNALKIGKIIGLEEDGALQIEDESGEVTNIRTGEIQTADPPLGGFRLHPVDRPGK